MGGRGPTIRCVSGRGRGCYGAVWAGLVAQGHAGGRRPGCPAPASPHRGDLGCPALPSSPADSLRSSIFFNWSLCTRQGSLVLTAVGHGGHYCTIYRQGNGHREARWLVTVTRPGSGGAGIRTLAVGAGVAVPLPSSFPESPLLVPGDQLPLEPRAQRWGAAAGPAAGVDSDRAQGPASAWLCGLGQVAQPLWASAVFFLASTHTMRPACTEPL